MTWEAIGAVSQGVAAIVVLPTLVYLALQIRESRRSNRSTALSTWAAGQAAILGQASADCDLATLLQKGWWNPNDLDEATWYRFMAWHQALLYHTIALQQMHADGIVADELFDLELSKSAAVLRTPGARQWWRAGGHTHVSATLAARLEREIDSPGRWSTVRWSRERGFHATADEEPAVKGPSIGEDGP
jgi:TPR repeat protein